MQRMHPDTWEFVIGKNVQRSLNETKRLNLVHELLTEGGPVGPTIVFLRVF